MFRKLKFVAKDLKKDFRVYGLALKDPRTPPLAKLLLSLSLGYAMLPFDLIPDFLPLIGHLDDAVVIPLLIRLSIKLIPKEVLRDCRGKARRKV